MEKRANQKKQRRDGIRSKLGKTFAIFLCIAFLAFLIKLTDMSTRRMIMCNDDRYAMAVSLQEGDMLRLDIAGEKLMLNIEPAVRIAEHAASASKRYCKGFVEFIKNGL